MDEKSDLTPIIMVDRGNCTFVTKVRNIEKAGVHLGIIIDNKSEDSENLIMSDDGTGTTINIPSFIIRKRDGDLIKDQLKKSNLSSVYVRAALELVHPDNRVEYEFWYSTILDVEPWLMYDVSLY
jgi:PA domain